MRESPRARHLRIKYGLTETAYAAMLEFQKGVCAICKKPPKPGRSLCVDHQHGGEHAGRIRGLLCFSCNRLLDYRWTTVLLLKAVEYLNPYFWTSSFIPKKKRKKRARSKV